MRVHVRPPAAAPAALPGQWARSAPPLPGSPRDRHRSGRPARRKWGKHGPCGRNGLIFFIRLEELLPPWQPGGFLDEMRNEGGFSSAPRPTPARSREQRQQTSHKVPQPLVQLFLDHNPAPLRSPSRAMLRRTWLASLARKKELVQTVATQVPCRRVRDW